MVRSVVQCILTFSNELLTRINNNERLNKQKTRFHST